MVKGLKIIKLFMFSFSHSMNVSLCICINIIWWGRQSEVIFCWLGLLQINHQRIFFFYLHLHKHEALWGELHIRMRSYTNYRSHIFKFRAKLKQNLRFSVLIFTEFPFSVFHSTLFMDHLFLKFPLSLSSQGNIPVKLLLHSNAF